MEKLTLPESKLRGKVDDESLSIIEQLTLLKLEYAREFLTAHGQMRSGERETVRLRLIELLESEPKLKAELRALLDELDAWGNQRVRLRVFPKELLTNFESRRAVNKIADTVGMSDLLDKKVALVPPETLTPMSISYEERDESRFLRLVAARTRILLTPEPETQEITFQEYPGIVFRPFRKETHKAVHFAEINLKTGHAIISSPTIRPGFAYTPDFEEFYMAFNSLISLGQADHLPLYQATHNIRHTLNISEVRIRARKARTNVGGTVSLTSYAPEADMRSDAQLLGAEKSLHNAPYSFCNCYWEATNGLTETVHTHVLAPEGEVLIMGQVREQSARHVLQRIYSIN